MEINGSHAPQDLPQELIELIALLCPSISTLRSFACTGKKIRKLVHKILNRKILIDIEWDRSEYSSEMKEEVYSIQANGNAMHQTWYQPEADRPRTYEDMAERNLKKFDDRFAFDRLYDKLLDIINMDVKNTAKFEEIIDKYKKQKQDPLFDNYEIIAFKTTIDEQLYRYKYIVGSQVWQSELWTDKEWIHSPADFADATWDVLDDFMILRLKHILCAIKTRKFFDKIINEKESTKSVLISYNPVDKEANPYHWEFTCNDLGQVKLHRIEKNYKRTTKTTQVQLKPWQVEEMFKNIEQYDKTIRRLKFDQEVQNEESNPDVVTMEDNNSCEKSDMKPEEDEKQYSKLQHYNYSFTTIDQSLMDLTNILDPVLLLLGVHFTWHEIRELEYKPRIY